VVRGPVGGVPVPSPWWRRAIAELLDLLVILMVGALILAIGGAHPYWHGGHLTDSEIAVRYVVAIVATFLYLPAILSWTGGRTGGKWLLGIAVVRGDGAPIGFWLAVWREVVTKMMLPDAIWLLLGPAVGGVYVAADVGWPIWSVRHLALHDILAQTRVIYLRAGSVPIRPTEAPVGDQGTFS
jgi:uncharacterized RDD family membrane protein YckC